MSIRQQMMASASRAKTILNDSATLVADFLHGRLNEDGGFADRNGKSDLYYTVFALEALLALGAEFPRQKILSYLKTFARGENLDFVHSACLARSLANLTDEIDPDVRKGLLHNIENARCEDGGYTHTGAQNGSIYGCFFATCCCQDLKTPLPDKKGLLNFIQSLHQPCGGYANQLAVPISTTPAAAAAMTILKTFDQPVNDSSARWLLDNCYKQGGFCVSENLPVPDLLSTATVLHALCINDIDITNIKQNCFDFVNSLRTGNGGFCASSADKTPDCEYTYYGLLALGHLGGG
jgi:hypothetical protein